MSDDTAKNAPARDGRAPMPAWKKAVLALGGLLLVAGLGMKIAGLAGGRDSPSPADGQTSAPAPSAGSGSGSSIAPNTFVPDGAGQPSPTEPGDADSPGGDGGSRHPLDDWSGVFTKLGFTFFVGFCIGYALRVFFKISAIAIGVILLAMFGLSYWGLVDIDWQAIEGYFDTFASKFGDQFESFRTFIEGELPSTGMVGLGLFTGFKKS